MTQIFLECEFISTLSIDDYYVFIAGSRTGINREAFVFPISIKTETGADIGTLRFEYSTSTNYVFTESLMKRSVIKTNKNSINVNNNDYLLNTASFTGKYSFYIFDANLGGTPSNRGTVMRLWRSQIYDNDTIVRDYIPVIDASSRPCLFDKVEKKCYYNQGTGEFLYG